MCNVTHCFSSGSVLKSLSLMIYMWDDLFPLLQATSSHKETRETVSVLSSHPEISGAKLFHVPVWGSDFAWLSFWRKHLTHAAELTARFAALIPLDSGVTSGVLDTDALWGHLHSDTGSHVPLMRFSLCLEIFNIFWKDSPPPPPSHFALDSASYIAGLILFS